MGFRKALTVLFGQFERVDNASSGSKYAIEGSELYKKL